jgi:hypothetical protein
VLREREATAQSKDPCKSVPTVALRQIPFTTRMSAIEGIEFCQVFFFIVSRARHCPIPPNYLDDGKLQGIPRRRIAFAFAKTPLRSGRQNSALDRRH